MKRLTSKDLLGFREYCEGQKELYALCGEAAESLAELETLTAHHQSENDRIVPDHLPRAQTMVEVLGQLRAARTRILDLEAKRRTSKTPDPLRPMSEAPAEGQLIRIVREGIYHESGGLEQLSAGWQLLCDEDGNHA